MKLCKLKQFVIDKEFQSKYVFYSLLMLLFVVASVFVVVIVWNHYRFFGGFLFQPPTEPQVASWAQRHNVKPDSAEFACQFILQAKPYSFFDILICPMLVILSVNIFVIAIAGFLISYKIARPIHELKMALRRKVETGQFEKPLTVHSDDPFHELTSLANLALFVSNHPEIKPFRETDDDAKLKV